MHICVIYLTRLPQELNEDLMNTWGALISQPPISPLDSAQKLSFIKYTTPNTGDSPPKTVITSESRGLILYSGTTGFRTWEAALHLGTYLSTPEDGQKLVCGKRVIELGAGTGFISFLIARHLGAESVLATDRDPVLVETIQRCIPRNALEPQRIGARVWEWGAEDSPLGDGNKFDVALGADLVRLFSSFHDIFKTLYRDIG
jgi:SAM-dependent methyltransferase